MQEYDGCLGLCPVTHFIAIALADDAFDNGYNTASAIYNAKIPKGTKRKVFRWKEDIKLKPILRSIRNTVVTDQPETYSALSTNWRQVCLDNGFETAPPFYSIRRGSSNAMNGTARCRQIDA